MPLSTARVATTRPERYIRQLVSHLGHKAGTELTADGRATITFARGTCLLTPSPGHLNLVASAADPEALAGVEDTIARHLLRFATQDTLDVQWTAGVAGEDVLVENPILDTYLVAHCTPVDDLLHELAGHTREVTGRMAGMQVSHDQGALLAMLVRLTGARRAVEVGVFTGYSSLCIARALPEDGHLLACDVNEEWAAIAREYWKRAGVDDRIELRIAPALDTLRALPDEPVLDIAFIDADKAAYRLYYEEIVRRLRPGGLVVLDNVFLGGRVLDPAYQQEDHLAMRDLNAFIARDDRVEAVMLPVRDGITLARKR